MFASPRAQGCGLGGSYFLEKGASDACAGSLLVWSFIDLWLNNRACDFYRFHLSLNIFHSPITKKRYLRPLHSSVEVYGCRSIN